MDQGIDFSRVGYALRLALLAVAAVLGLLILGAIFGSSSASAATADDDPAPSLGSTLGGVVHEVTEVAAPVAAAIAPVAAPITAPAAPVTAPVTDAVETITASSPAASVTTPVAAVADTALVTATTKILGSELSDAVLGSTPVGSLLTPVAAAVDEALAGADDALVQTLRPAVAVLASNAAAVATVAQVLHTPALLAGSADGVLPLEILGGQGDPSVLGIAGGASPLPAAVLGGGLALLLAAWRRGLLTPAMPGSPVYATDSSPD
ncbi:MAG TPA: hypothetical protein VNR36_01485 [Pseudolysinimonas sp.]|nr:hypothetical protein [Pseudolysinimonas sp.]